jgi:hypothetical protein
MVYALHHFNATVEGQANAAKGEHMVLLDDSNSYWWLVRIVRNGSIGESISVLCPLGELFAELGCHGQDTCPPNTSRLPPSVSHG